MNVDEVIQQPGMKERFLKEDIMKSIHVAVPGEVVSYNATNRTATIQPVIREWNSKEVPPLLTDVPVYFWGNCIFTPHKGDGCLVICADSCIDSWIQSGGVSTPVVSRTHSLSDGFAFIGFRQTDGKDIDKLLDVVNKQNNGLCPKLPDETSITKFLRQDGTWASPADSTYTAGAGLVLNNNEFSLDDSGATAGSYGPSENVTGTEGTTMSVPYLTVDEYGRVTSIENKTYTSKDTTYSNFVKSGSTASNGLVPSPGTTAGTTKYLREDATWQVPPDTKYSNFVKSGSGAKQGLVPAPSTTAGTTKYLREDCTWQVPPNTGNTWRGYQIKSYSYSYTISANANLNVTGTNLKVSTPSGYTPVAISRIATGTNSVVVRSFYAQNTGSSNVVSIRSVSSTSLSDTLNVDILYLQTGQP